MDSVSLLAGTSASRSLRVAVLVKLGNGSRGFAEVVCMMDVAGTLDVVSLGRNRNSQNR